MKIQIENKPQGYLLTIQEAPITQPKYYAYSDHDKLIEKIRDLIEEMQEDTQRGLTN